MTVKTSPHQRQQMVALHQQGTTYAEIAERFLVSAMLVRYWCRRQRDGKGCQSPSHPRPKGLLTRFAPRVAYVVLRLRLEHPKWGPNRIREGMKKRPSLLGCPLPSDAEIGRYLHQWRRFRRPIRRTLAPSPGSQPTRVHQCWQVDFKVQIHLRDGTWLTLSTARDPVGAAIIGCSLEATGQHTKVKMEAVRGFLRHCFARWGLLPEEIQTDGEASLVSPHKHDFPSLFTLWLVGLGMTHRVIRKVTQNAQVERCHRTLNEYALVGNEGEALRDLAWQLDHSVYELNYELPSQAQGCAGRPPIIAHPELLQVRRPYRADQELCVFDLQRVDQYLAGFVWTHRVNRNGQVSIGPHQVRYTVSRAHAGQEVEVRFDPQDRHLVFSPVGQPDEILRRCRVKGLEVADLTGLTVWPEGVGYQQLCLPNLFDPRGKLLMSK
jgi:putative transposase